MDFENLRLFLHLSGTLHFGRTSRECFVSPPTLTRVIQRLEEECGKPLFVRDRRFTELTPAGRDFVEFARSTLQRWEEMRGSLGAEGASLRGELRLYCSVTASYTILPDLLGTFRQRHPHVLVRLTTGDAAEAVDRVLSGATDVAIGALADTADPTLEVRELLRPPLIAIAPKLNVGFPLKDLERAQPEAWSLTPFIQPSGGALRRCVDAWLAKIGARPRVNSTVSGHEAILSLVSLGLGVGMIPGIVLDRSLFRAQVRRLHVTKPLPEFPVGVSTARSRLKSPVVRAFWSGLDAASPRPSRR